MIKKIRLLLEYNTYCVWLYDENDEIIDNNNPPEWDNDQELTDAFMAVSDIYDTFLLENEKEFKYVGCKSQDFLNHLKKAIERAVNLITVKNDGKYELINDINLSALYCEMMICEQCGSETEDFIDGSTCGTKCKKCGWSIVTTYQDPIKLDDTSYTLIIEPIKNPSVEVLRCIASLLGCNYLQTKEKSQERICFKNKACEILNIAKVLCLNNIAFSITPKFPYEF